MRRTDEAVEYAEKPLYARFFKTLHQFDFPLSGLLVLPWWLFWVDSGHNIKPAIEAPAIEHDRHGLGMDRAHGLVRLARNEM